MVAAFEKRVDKCLQFWEHVLSFNIDRVCNHHIVITVLHTLKPVILVFFLFHFLLLRKCITSPLPRHTGFIHFRKFMAVYCDNRLKNRNTMRGENSNFCNEKSGVNIQQIPLWIKRSCVREIYNATNPVVCLFAKPNSSPQWNIMILIIAFRKDFSNPPPGMFLIMGAGLNIQCDSKRWTQFRKSVFQN
jgi:hypothetical protein